jgi:hypothetical protein
MHITWSGEVWRFFWKFARAAAVGDVWNDSSSDLYMQLMACCRPLPGYWNSKNACKPSSRGWWHSGKLQRVCRTTTAAAAPVHHNHQLNHRVMLCEHNRSKTQSTTTAAACLRQPRSSSGRRSYR